MTRPDSARLPRVMVITDRRLTGSRSLGDVVTAALEGGARLVQLREKDLEGRELLGLAKELRVVTARHGAVFLVNDRIDVALAAEADGVVLPARSFETAIARTILGPGRRIARSTHSLEEAARAADERCDFALFGPVFATPAKASFGDPQGLGRLREATTAPIPVFAVGGIDSSNARAAFENGAYGIAVIRAVMSAPDPGRAASDLCSAGSALRV